MAKYLMGWPILVALAIVFRGPLLYFFVYLIRRIRRKFRPKKEDANTPIMSITEQRVLIGRKIPPKSRTKKTDPGDQTAQELLDSVAAKEKEKLEKAQKKYLDRQAKKAEYRREQRKGKKPGKKP